MPEGWRAPDRRREPRAHRGPHEHGGADGHERGAHLEGFRGGAAPPPRVRRHRRDPEVPGVVMGHDPWSDLRESAETARGSIESALKVQTAGSLVEAPEDRGLFALATHPWAKELKASPVDIASRAARVRPPPSFDPFHAAR